MTSRPGDFSRATRNQLRARAGHTCAYPGCGAITSVPALGNPGALDLGCGSHIVAAGEKGERPASENDGITIEQIRCADNGIWLCVFHAQIVDKDSRFQCHDVATLRRWQQEAEERAARQGGYTMGRPLRVYASPHDVAPRAMAFYFAVRDIPPPGSTRFLPDVRADHVRQLRAFLQSVSPFLPTHPLHGIDADLVAVQQQALEDLRGLAYFIEQSGAFWYDPDRDIWIPNDRSETGATITKSEGVLERVWWMIRRVADKWGQGQGYYGWQ